MALNVGDKAPSFELVDTDLKMRSLDEFKGKKVILSFYMPVGFTMQCVSIKLQSHPNTGKKNTNLFYMREKKDRILNLLLGM